MKQATPLGVLLLSVVKPTAWRIESRWEATGERLRYCAMRTRRAMGLVLLTPLILNTAWRHIPSKRLVVPQPARRLPVGIRYGLIYKSGRRIGFACRWRFACKSGRRIGFACRWRFACKSGRRFGFNHPQAVGMNLVPPASLVAALNSEAAIDLADKVRKGFA